MHIETWVLPYHHHYTTIILQGFTDFTRREMLTELGCPLGYKLCCTFVWHCMERPNYGVHWVTSWVPSLFDIAGRGQIIALATIQQWGNFGAFPWVLQAVPLPLDNGLGSADSGTYLTLELGLELKWAVPSLTQPMYYNTCTVRSSENLCSSCAGAQENERKGNFRNHQNWWFSEFHPWFNANVLFLQVFL
jgi:hypothetical protein